MWNVRYSYTSALIVAHGFEQKGTERLSALPKSRTSLDVMSAAEGCTRVLSESVHPPSKTFRCSQLLQNDPVLKGRKAEGKAGY